MKENEKWQTKPASEKEEKGLNRKIKEEIEKPHLSSAVNRFLGRRSRVDQSVALSEAIKANDPKLKHAFTPEAAEKFLKKKEKKKD